MDSCEINVLHQNEFGYIRHCNHCGEVQLVFGNVLFHVQEHLFLTFCSGMQSNRDSMLAEFKEAAPCQKLLLATKDDHLKIAVNRQELNALFELIDVATMMMEAKTLLQA